MLLLQTGQKTLSGSAPAPSIVAPKGESLSDNEPCEDHRERETQHDLKIKVIQMRDNMTRKQISNIKRSELCLSMLIPSGERCSAVCGAGGWWWARVEGECLL